MMIFTGEMTQETALRGQWSVNEVKGQSNRAQLTKS